MWAIVIPIPPISSIKCNLVPLREIDFISLVHSSPSIAIPGGSTEENSVT